MNAYRYKVAAKLGSHSCKFQVEANNLGEALRRADEEFHKIYCLANNFPENQALLTWGDRSIHVEQEK